TEGIVARYEGTGWGEWVRRHPVELRRHAVPIQMSAMIDIPARAGGGTKRAATIAPFGIHHADALVRGLPSQSRELWTTSFAMMTIWHSTKRRPSHPTVRPGSAGTDPRPRQHTSHKRP